MQILKCFSPEKAKFLLEADVNLVGSIATFEFSLTDKLDQFVVPTQTQKWAGSQIPRQEGLWNTTCFEAFLNPTGLGLYYEFNFSFKPAWNVYGFDRYRHPQPPLGSEDFQLQSMVWDQFENRFIINLENKSKYKKFRVGLSAVLEDKSGNKHYCALVHKGAKPDFHLLESFTLMKG